MRALKYKRPEGYVAYWVDGYDAHPIANFGDYQSACIDYCIMLNRLADGTDEFMRYINNHIKNYNPDERFTYPEFKGTMGVKSIILRRQR